MEVTEPPNARPTTPDAEGRPSRSGYLGNRSGSNTYRGLGHLVGGIVGLSLVSVRASAHEGVGHGGTPVAFAVVIGLPVVAGFLGGVGTILYRNRTTTNTAHRPASATLGFLLIALGGTFAVTAVTRNPSLGLAGGTVGILTTLWLVNRNGGEREGCGRHTDLALGGVCGHRAFEGVILGTLYTAGTAVGLAGAVAIAGHTALETAAVSGLYASRGLRALGVVVLVQVGYVAGAVFGVGVTGSVPAWAQITSLGLVAGILLITGVDETKHSTIAIGPGRVPE